MKLIDILVRELPKRGGWPEGADHIATNGYWRVFAYWDGSSLKGIDLNISSDAEGYVTREQYEAALAASKPEWGGEGIPPVGCCVEANYGGVWVKATVAYTEPPEKYSAVDTWKEALVFDCNTTRPFWTDEFRPIRSEADKKRENLAKALHIAAGAAPIEVVGIGPLYLELADKILAGEVAGIRID